MKVNDRLLHAIRVTAEKQKLPNGEQMLAGHMLLKAAERIEYLEQELSKSTTKLRCQTVGNCLSIIEGLSNARDMRIELQKYHSELSVRAKQLEQSK